MFACLNVCFFLKDNPQHELTGSQTLTSLDVAQCLCLLSHSDALPPAGPLQVQSGNEGQCDGGQVLLHAAAGHLDEPGQGVVAD